MIVDVVIRVPCAEPAQAMEYLHDAASRLGRWTVNPNTVILNNEEKLFKPVEENGDGGGSWKMYTIQAECHADKVDKSVVKSIHRNLVANVDVPSEVAVQTRVEDKDIYLFG